VQATICLLAVGTKTKTVTWTLSGCWRRPSHFWESSWLSHVTRWLVYLYEVIAYRQVK